MTRVLSSVLLAVFAVSATRGQDCILPYQPVGGYCIYIDPFVTGTQAEVRANCKAHGGDLIWFEPGIDCDLFGEVVAHIHENNLNEHNYWMGISDEGHEGDWRFLKTNQPVRLGAPFWWTGSPAEATNKNCAILAKGVAYYFQDVPCTDKVHSTICRRN